MIGKKLVTKRVVVVFLGISVLLYSNEASARSRHVERYRPHNNRHSWYFVAPILGGLTYLYCNGLAAAKRETTFVVVPASANTVLLPAAPSVETTTISIPNSNGSYTQVTLRKSGSGYIGPQGEYYPGHPTVTQLKALYGM